MTNTNLVLQADELQQHANEVLKALNLFRFLSNYGFPRVVGSAALGLMTWRDIDIDLEVPGNLKEEDFWETSKYLLAKEKVTLLTLTDNRHMKEKNRPPSMYIGVKYIDNKEAIWKIDIRFVSEENAIAQKYIDSIKPRLTTEARKAILDIKSIIAHDTRYRTEISSVDIYNAVLEEGVVDLDGFKEKLRESDIEL